METVKIGQIKTRRINKKGTFTRRFMLFHWLDMPENITIRQWKFMSRYAEVLATEYRTYDENNVIISKEKF